MNLFKYGGLKDDGRNKDPVSGNNVPSGSMAKEVRDDLPAMLSEGEYVVPADVVRYFGVNYFEDLRNKAKSGLTNMEKDGRIGGEPIDKPIMANQGALTTASVTTPNRYTGEFSFEKPGAGSYRDDGYEAPSPTTCAAKGKTYDPILRVCVTSPIAPPAVNIPAPVTSAPRVSTGDDNSTSGTTTSGGSGVALSTPWYEETDWVNPETAANDLFDYAQPFGVIGGIYGMARGTTALSTARAMQNIYEAMGDPFGTNAAETMKNKIQSELDDPRTNLEGADSAFDRLFGTDGDVRTIRALKAAGIDVNKDLRDTDLDAFLMDLGGEDRLKLKKKYGAYTDEKTEEKYKDDQQFQQFGIPTPVTRTDQEKTKVKDESGDNVYSTAKVSTGGGPTVSKRPQLRPDNLPTPTTTTKKQSGTGFFRGEDESGMKGSGSSKGGYSCYVATALNDNGYWSLTKKIRLLKWCMDTKPEGKFDTTLWRNGYCVFGKKIVAPHVHNKYIQWLSNGFYNSTVKNKNTFQAVVGKLFFYVPSYTIGLVKALTGNLKTIDRT